MTERTNEQWVANLKADLPTQTTAIEDLHKRLKRSLYYYLSNERSDLATLASQELDQMAQDIAQDAVLRVRNNLDTFRGASLFTTWATKIAIRMAISDLRRAHYKDFSLDEMTIGGELLPNFAERATDSLQGTKPANPESEAERKDVLAKINSALEEALTERQRQALVAIAIDGIPLEIVADRMGTNRNALYKLLHDARKKLKQHLETQGLPTHYMIQLFQG